MSRADADRNLLLGILAQQMDFVTRDAFLAAMNDWTSRKETSLAELLVERGELPGSRRDLLEALVDEHIRVHSDDAAQSLAALSSIGSVLDELAKVEDVDVQVSLGHLYETVVPNSGDDDPYSTRGPSPGSLSSPGQPQVGRNNRFRVVRHHAKGGLGVVSVAFDNELDREVAFKEIKDEYADNNGSRAQFVLEAEITGKLEHPGIIPIYGLGTDQTGRPFYAMRFIRGDSLADAIEQHHSPKALTQDATKRSLELRELLGRFLDVCDALEYAHSRGVLHRDLKPGNIMLGPFGETLVVDWGLALPLNRVPEGFESTQDALTTTKTDSASLPREKGRAVGTPAYMPPEQAAGDFERLGARSDVYGLGAILYELLTGKRPVSGTTIEEVLDAVSKGEIKPPRSINSQISPALEAVCMKALSFKPEARYAAPRALAADVKTWLADEPVSARREPFHERARRWAKRNRTIVASGVVALLVGLLGFGVVAAVQTKAKNVLDAKNGELDEKNKALVKQTERVESRESQAINAVKRYRDSVVNNPTLKNNLALESLRKELLKEPLAFFRMLRDQLLAEKETRWESLERLAFAASELAQLTDEIGDKEDAIEATRVSLEIYRKMVEDNPTVAELQVNLSTSHCRIGVLLGATGQFDEAMKAYKQALTILQKLADANPTVLIYQKDIAGIHSNIGRQLLAIGQTGEAMKAHKQALAIFQKLADANPTVTEYQLGVSACHSYIGILLGDNGQTDESLKSLTQSLVIMQKLVDANPNVTEYQDALATSHSNVGKLLGDKGQTDEALKAHRRALEARQKLANTNPTVTKHQDALAANHYNIGAMLVASGRIAEAMKAFKEALEIWQKLVDADPVVTDYQSSLANCYSSLGVLLNAIGQNDEALKAVKQALAIRQKLFDARPTLAISQYNLALGHDNNGVLLNATGHPDEAMKAYKEALAILQKLIDTNPTVTEYQNGLASTHSKIASIHLGTERFAEARDRLKVALAHSNRAFNLNPQQPEVRSCRTIILNNLERAGRGLTDPAILDEVQRERDAMEKSDPWLIALDQRLAAIAGGLCQAQFVRGTS
jgi:serine/threonine-protein kinase